MPLKRGTVELSAYDPSWAETYKQEEKRLKKALGDSAIEIRHDGSTAVAGMTSKPIIDILLAVESLNEIEPIESELEKLGYEHVPQADLPGRIFFSKGNGDMREFHLSLTEKDNFHWKTHLLFLEQLRNNARVRDEYTRLKQTLAKKFPNDRGAYTAGKREFIDTILASPEDKFKENEMETRMNKIVLWDFDGVIVPSFNAGLETYRVFHPDYSEDEYRKGYEGNIFHNSRHLKMPQAKFNKEYGSRAEKLGIVEQIDIAIKKITAQYTSVIVSSSSNAIITSFLVRHVLEDRFKKIYGHDVHTSKIEKIGMALKEFDSDAKNAVFITDTLGDIREAEAHNMNTIAVTWGFHPRETLEKGKPDVIVEKPEELTKEVEKMLK